MKKLIYLLAISIVLVSCGSKNEESIFIPKDAVGLMYVNLKSLSKKSENLNFKDLNINKLIEDEAPDEIKAFLNEHMTAENIDKTFRKEFILGFVNVKRMSGVGGLILPIKDAASFEAFIQGAIDKIPGLEKETNVGKGEAYTVYSTREVAIGWDNKTALIIGAGNYAGSELKDLTTLTKSESILSTKYYNSFLKDSEDMGMYITSGPVGDMFSGMLNTFSGVNVDLNDNSFTYYSSFENDHIHTDGKLKLNDDFKSVLGYEKWMTTDYNTSMLKVLPKDVQLLVKVSMDTDKFYKHLFSLQNNKVLPIQVRDEMKKGFLEADKETIKELGMSTEEIAQIFDNSAMLALTEGEVKKDSFPSYDYETKETIYETYEVKNPNVYVAFGIKDRAKFDKLFDVIKKEESSIKEVSKDYYEAKDVRIIISDDMVYITNDKMAADEVNNAGKLTGNLSDFEHKSKLSHSIYVYTSGNMYGVMSDYMMPFYGAYRNPYQGKFMEDFTAKTGEIYNKFFGDNHLFIDEDGMESFTHTKGDENSLIQSILYVDELAKVAGEQAKAEEEKRNAEVEDTVEEAVDAAEEAVDAI